jgi:lyso-ornithine lipid O-acyltransferase
VLKIVWRAPLVAAVIIVFLLAAFGVGVVARNRLRRQRWRNNVTHLAAQIANWICGIRVATSAIPAGSGSGRLLVANHLSYIDAMVFASVTPMVFVTSVEVGETPFLGWIARAAGCVLMERRTLGKIPSELTKLDLILRSGFDVLVFPEATSTDGAAVLPFRNAVFSVVESGEFPVVPVGLRYTNADRKYDPTVLERVCWYGLMGFASHFLNLLASRPITAELEWFAPTIAPRGASRKTIAKNAHQIIEQWYRKSLVVA